ncbi:MAG: GNVR domain-containing protein [Steroidobacteraceae bacterium]
MSLPRAFLVLWVRRSWIVTILSSIVALTAIVSLLVPKSYVAETVLVIDFKGGDPLAQSNLSSPLLSTYMNTQKQIIASRNVALQVIESVGTDKLAAAKGGSAQDPGSGLAQSYVAWVLEGLTTTSAADGNILRISYRAPDPKLAAEIANAFASAYIQTSLELQVDPAKRQSTWFEEQTQALRRDFAQAQGRLDAFQRGHGVLDVDHSRIDVENARLQEVASQLVKAQATMYDAETRSSQARGADTDLPDLLQNPLLQSLKSELARAEAKFADLSERVDRNHPQYRSASAEVASLRAKLGTEIVVVKQSLAQSADIANRQVREVQSALNEQKQRIIALRQQRDELAVLNRDVESARAAYEGAVQQANQVRLQSRVNRTNIAVLTNAIVPTGPASPRLGLNFALAAVMGAFLAAGVALYAEAMRPRLRQAEDLIASDLPVLAELPRLPNGKVLAKKLEQPVRQLQAQMRPRLT